LVKYSSVLNLVYSKQLVRLYKQLSKPTGFLRPIAVHLATKFGLTWKNVFALSSTCGGSGSIFSTKCTKLIPRQGQGKSTAPLSANANALSANANVLSATPRFPPQL
jgi:hypothetical protein